MFLFTKGLSFMNLIRRASSEHIIYFFKKRKYVVIRSVFKPIALA